MKYIGIYNDPEYGAMPLYAEEANFDNVAERERWNEIVEDGGGTNGRNENDIPL